MTRPHASSRPRLRAGATHLGPAGLAVLLLSALLIAASSFQVAYRITLPTEGWDYTSEDVGEVIFTRNLLGEPSPLRPGDSLRTVEGLGTVDMEYGRAPKFADDWRAGQVVRYAVVRDGRSIDLEVPLKRWTPSAVLRHNLGSVERASGVLVSLLLLGIGLVVLRKRPREAAARALLLLSVAWLASGIATIVPVGPSTQLSRMWLPAAFFQFWIFGVLVGPTVVAFALVFPEPKGLVRRFPWLAVAPYLALPLLAAAFGLRPEILWGLTLLNLLLSLVIVIHSAFIARDAVSRAQLRWGLGGFLAALVLFLPSLLPGVLELLFGLRAEPGSLLALLGSLSVLSVFILPVFTGCLAVAILRYRLFDIDLIIRRTLVYGVLTALLAAVYGGGVVLLRGIAAGFGGGRSDLAIVASTLAVAALFAPLRRRLQGVIDRRFYRRKYDAARTLATHATSMRDEVDLDALSGELVEVVRATMQPAHVGVWLQPSADLRRGSVRS